MEVEKEENIFVEPKFPLPKVQRGVNIMLGTQQ
jgi:hypothetical protein